MLMSLISGVSPFLVEAELQSSRCSLLFVTAGSFRHHPELYSRFKAKGGKTCKSFQSISQDFLSLSFSPVLGWGVVGLRIWVFFTKVGTIWSAFVIRSPDFAFNHLCSEHIKFYWWHTPADLASNRPAVGTCHRHRILHAISQALYSVGQSHVL